MNKRGLLSDALGMLGAVVASTPWHSHGGRWLGHGRGADVGGVGCRAK